MASLLNAGGGVVGPGTDSSECKAFRAAAKRWCTATKPKNRKGKFNDYFFEELEKVDSKLAGELKREMPIGVINSTGAVHNLASLATRSGPLADAAGDALKLIASGGSAATQGAQTFDSFRMLISKDIHGIFRGADRSLEKVLVPDGLYPDNTPLEIKGPGDGPHPSGGENSQSFAQ